ncbi:HAD-IIA family hydrolase [Luedemannella helvata]|uniref:HAD-IIA family hydrolase n=1 Tax=Luedemannella helvata TaxID=349315 RepID=UPI003CD0B9A2
MAEQPSATLATAYDLIIFDLDGVVYVGTEPVPGAADAIARLAAAGTAVAYATNNASRRAQEVADLLGAVGVPATAAEVLTSAEAAARLLAADHPAGSPILVVGAPALRADVAAAGLVPVSGAADGPVAVVQGYGPQLGWADLAEASVAIRAGARWVATNTDATLPSPRGPLPGNGSLVAALAHALGRGPDAVVGKPEPALFEVAAQRYGAANPLVVGDRLDTDIEGANRAGMPSLVVLTGVTQPADLLEVAPALRPTHLATDLSGLFEPEALVRIPACADPAEGAGAGGWRVTATGDELLLDGSGDATDALRALVAVAWATSGRAVQVTPAGTDAERALAELNLPVAAVTAASAVSAGHRGSPSPTPAPMPRPQRR